MTVALICHLLKCAIEHYETCEISKLDDLPNACFGLLKSYGLFASLPTSDHPLGLFARKSIEETGEKSLHTARIIMRALIKFLHEKAGAQCAVMFANSAHGKEILALTLQNRTGYENQATG